MNQNILLKFIIRKNKFELIESNFELKDISKNILDDETTIFRIGNLIRGYTEILIHQDSVSILTDEFLSFPLFYYYSSNMLCISNKIKMILSKTNCKLLVSDADIINFINNGFFLNSTGFQNIQITPNSNKTIFSSKNDKLIIKNEMIKYNSETFEKNNFEQLFNDLLISTEFLLKSEEYHTVDLTGGVDTRLILGILFELGIEKKYTFVTDKSDENDRKYDFEIASQICEKFKLNHQEKGKKNTNQFDQTNCLSGKYGSEFFSGEFPNFWGEYQTQDRSFHFPNLPYFENHISPLNDLYYIYGTSSFVDSVSNLYNINNTPYKMRNSLLSLNRIPLKDQKSYGFHNYIFNNKLKWLTGFSFYSNFSNFNNTFKFVKKNISPKDPNTYDKKSLFFLQPLNDLSVKTLNDSNISLFDKKIRLSRVKLLDEYYKTHMSHYSK